jgi:hypothetical protein
VYAHQAPWLNRVAIEKINNITRQENIKMVFITGKRPCAHVRAVPSYANVSRMA